MKIIRKAARARRVAATAGALTASPCAGSRRRWSLQVSRRVAKAQVRWAATHHQEPTQAMDPGCLVLVAPERWACSAAVGAVDPRSAVGASDRTDPGPD